MSVEVRYCTTSDGVRIAYTKIGEGPPLVLRSDAIVSHVELEWTVGPIAKALRRLALTNTLIRFDQRGSGLSDRVFAASMGEALRDTVAVVDALLLDTFSNGGRRGHPRSAYTAFHPATGH